MKSKADITLRAMKKPNTALSNTTLALVSTLALLACDGTPIGNGTREDSGSYVPDGGDQSGTRDAGHHDAGMDAGHNAGHDAGSPPPSRIDDDGSVDETDAGPRCMNDGDCQDGVFCNGAERCLHGRCVAPTEVACPGDYGPCTEATHECVCADPDQDHDGFSSTRCKDGHDCDDDKPNIFPGALEACDDVDDDCDPTTIGTLDADGDGEVSSACSNTDTVTHVVTRGPDCDDQKPLINTRAAEVCDYVDNNCNGYIDEKDGETEDHGLFQALYPDEDHDLAGAEDGGVLLGCADRVPGYVTNNYDCADNDPKRNRSATEYCNGVDDDCDQRTDAEDDQLQMPKFTGTTLECDHGHEVIVHCPGTTLWCSDTVDLGCNTDGTTMSNCGGCGVKCVFSCGDIACDEVEKLSLGSQHSCAVTVQGRAACWGRGGDGRLGNDSTGGSLVPDAVAGLSDVTAIAAGDTHTCAVAAPGGTAFCWGNNAYDQLGSSSGGTFASVPVEVIDFQGNRLTGVTSIAAAAQHSCAALASGEARCWGTRDDGRLGMEDTIVSGIMQQASVVVRIEHDDFLDIDLLVPLDDVDTVAVGAAHSCALTKSHTVACWGDNRYGQLGIDPGTKTASGVAATVAGLSGVTTIATGNYFTCGGTVSGEAVCWGANGEGQLGRSSGSTNHVPTAVQGITNVKSVIAGNSFACAVTTEGQLWCWGANTDGRFGALAPAQSATPIQLPIEGVVAAAAGNHLCALTQSGQVLCLGLNSFGQLGNGSSSSNPQFTPVPLRALKGSKP